jgi:hypothetical protein
MTSFIQNMGFIDTLELKVFRPQPDGSLKLIAERVTTPRMLNVQVPSLTNIYIKFLKVLGLGDKYAGDLIVNAGLVDVAQMIYDQYDYVGIGTGTAGPTDPAYTALQTQVETRVAPTKSIVTTTITNDTAQFSGQFTLTAPRILTESGLFVLASGGVMLARQVFSAINLNTSDIITFVWKIQVARSA